MKLFHFKHQWKWAPVTSDFGPDAFYFFLGQKKTRNPDGNIKIKYATARMEYCPKCGERRGVIDYGDSGEIVSPFYLNSMVQAGHFQVVRHNPLAIQTSTPLEELPKTD